MSKVHLHLTVSVICKDILPYLLIAWAMSNLACSQRPTSASDVPSIMAIPQSLCGDEPSPAADDARPDVLVIGDSVSLGWYPKFQDLNSQLDVEHNPCNGMNSRNGAARISDWLKERPYWAMVVFNHGLWDVTPITSGENSWFFYTSREEYENNLITEADQILLHTNCAIYLLTTEVPINTAMNDEVLARNEIAIRVMAEKGIKVLDLYSISQTSEHLSPGNIHYSDAGSLKLAQYINDNALCSL